MRLPELVPRIAAGLGLSVALAGFGLWFTGTPVRALGLGRLAPLGAPPGAATQGGPQELVINGEPTRVWEGWIPSQRPEEVLRHYAAEAARETEPAGLPFLSFTASDGGGQLLWARPDGQRRAVIVEPDPRGGCRTRILEVDRPGRRQAPHVPGGIELPGGVRLVFSMAPDPEQGLALLESRGDPLAVAGRMSWALQRGGFQLEPLRPEEAGDAVAVPFRDATRQGLLVVQPDADGGSRVLLRLQRG